jgi:hypothetical protein
MLRAPVEWNGRESPNALGRQIAHCSANFF